MKLKKRPLVMTSKAAGPFSLLGHTLRTSLISIDPCGCELCADRPSTYNEINQHAATRWWWPSFGTYRGCTIVHERVGFQHHPPSFPCAQATNSLLREPAASLGEDALCQIGPVSEARSLEVE